jgi:hypothetical protein
VDVLERIIENLTSDEVRRFKILSNRFKADEEKKVLILFDAIRAGNFDETEDELIEQLYGGTDAREKNNYYRLRNKLLSNLEKSLLFYHFNYKNTIESYSYIQLAILLKERGSYREAYYYLRKAEKMALRFDQFNVLEVIYDEMVQLAVRDVDIDIEEVIEKRKENMRKIEIRRSTSEVLGVILQQIRRLNFSRGRSSQSVIDMLEETRAQLEEHAHIFRSANGRIDIYRAISTILLKKGAYKELESYILKTFNSFEEDKVFDRNSHPLRLQMRTWRINSLRKLLRLQEEAEEIKLLFKDLKAFGRQNFNEYAVYYYNATINNLKLRGLLDESAQAIKEAFNTKAVTQSEINVLYLLISRADQYFSQELHEKAFETIQEITSHNKFNTLDREMQFYLAIFELVNGYEAKNHDFVESQYKRFKKKYKAQLKDEYYAKAQRFIDLILRLNTAAIEGKKVFLNSAYKRFTSEFPVSEVSDNQIIMFEVYLRAKLEERPYFHVFSETLADMMK